MGFALSGMQLSSPAFTNGGGIADKHTGTGADVSPALSFSDLPDGTASLAIICHDPDAPLIKPGTYGFVHWVLYNIPGASKGLPEATPDGTAGVNDFGRQAYGGPMPPNGHGTHHYFFWLLALDAELELEGGLSMWDLLRRIEPHVIGMNRLLGTYRRD